MKLGIKINEKGFWCFILLALLVCLSVVSFEYPGLVLGSLKSSPVLTNIKHSILITTVSREKLI